MELFPGVNLAMVATLAVVATGIVEWFKNEEVHNKWLVRGVSLLVSFGLVALVLLLSPMTWQVYLVSSILVWASANGVWHLSNKVI